MAELDQFCSADGKELTVKLLKAPNGIAVLEEIHKQSMWLKAFTHVKIDVCRCECVLDAQFVGLLKKFSEKGIQVEELDMSHSKAEDATLKDICKQWLAEGPGKPLCKVVLNDTNVTLEGVRRMLEFCNKRSPEYSSSPLLICHCSKMYNSREGIPAPPVVDTQIQRQPEQTANWVKKAYQAKWSKFDTHSCMNDMEAIKLLQELRYLENDNAPRMLNLTLRGHSVSHLFVEKMVQCFLQLWKAQGVQVDLDLSSTYIDAKCLRSIALDWVDKCEPRADCNRAPLGVLSINRTPAVSDVSIAEKLKSVLLKKYERDFPSCSLRVESEVPVFAISRTGNPDQGHQQGNHRPQKAPAPRAVCTFRENMWTVDCTGRGYSDEEGCRMLDEVAKNRPPSKPYQAAWTLKLSDNRFGVSFVVYLMEHILSAKPRLVKVLEMSGCDITNECLRHITRWLNSPAKIPLHKLIIHRNPELTHDNVIKFVHFANNHYREWWPAFWLDVHTSLFKQLLQPGSAEYPNQMRNLERIPKPTLPHSTLPSEPKVQVTEVTVCSRTGRLVLDLRKARDVGATLVEAINKKLADPDTKSFQCGNRKVAAAVLELSGVPRPADWIAELGRTLKRVREQDTPLLVDVLGVACTGAVPTMYEIAKEQLAFCTEHSLPLLPSVMDLRFNEMPAGALEEMAETLGKADVQRVLIRADWSVDTKAVDGVQVLPPGTDAVPVWADGVCMTSHGLSSTSVAHLCAHVKSRTVFYLPDYDTVLYMLDRPGPRPSRITWKGLLEKSASSVQIVIPVQYLVQLEALQNCWMRGVSVSNFVNILLPSLVNAGVVHVVSISSSCSSSGVPAAVSSTVVRMTGHDLVASLRNVGGDASVAVVTMDPGVRDSCGSAGMDIVLRKNFLERVASEAEGTDADTLLASMEPWNKPAPVPAPAVIAPVPQSQPLPPLLPSSPDAEPEREPEPEPEPEREPEREPEPEPACPPSLSDLNTFAGDNNIVLRDETDTADVGDTEHPPSDEVQPVAQEGSIADAEGEGLDPAAEPDTNEEAQAEPVSDDEDKHSSSDSGWLTS